LHAGAGFLKMPGVDAVAPIVEARGLCKDYGARRVVTDVSFALARGHCLGLLGPNGAGKTTTIRMVTCFTAPSAGALAVLGLPTTPANHAAIKAGLGIVQQDESLDPDLSVEQNLIVYASYFGIARGAAVPRAEALMRFAELTELLPAPPAALIVTIPTPESADAVRRALRAALERGATALGVVENMVGGPFAGSAADDLAREFGVPVLARIPFHPRADVWDGIAKCIGGAA